MAGVGPGKLSWRILKECQGYVFQADILPEKHCADRINVNRLITLDRIVERLDS